MPIFTPRITSKPRGILIKQDVTIKRGEWLVVHEDDRIEVLTSEEMRRNYTMEQIAPKPSSQKWGAQRGGSYSLNGHRATAQQIRTMTAMTEVEMETGQASMTSADIKRLVIKRDANQVSARLTELVNRGLVTKARRGDDRNVWSLTEAGREIEKKLGDNVKVQE